MHIGEIEMEEIFDVTDDNGFPVGRTVTRSEAHDKGIPHRTAHIWIVRKAVDSYQVLLQKRSANKESLRYWQAMIRRKRLRPRRGQGALDGQEG